MSAVPTPSPARPRPRPTIVVPSLADLLRLVRASAADTHRWQSVLRLPDGKDRWWTQLSTNDDVDVWLLSWRPGQATALHDHGSSAAAFTVIRGELNEVRIDPYGQATSQSRPAGTATLARSRRHTRRQRRRHRCSREHPRILTTTSRNELLPP
jgi:cysteine dioxygenase type I